jgi:hypothetical protein
VRAPLDCSPNEKPIDAASGTVPVITAALDDELPGQGQLSDGGFTNDTTPTLTGTLPAQLAAGELVRVYGADGLLLGASTASTGESGWQFTTPPLAAGASYSFTARVEGNDAAGGSASNLFRLVISTGGPQKIVTIISINGNGQSTGFTNDSSVSVIGSVSPALAAGETVQLTRSGLPAVTVPGCSEGCTAWSFSETLTTDAAYDYQGNAVGINGVPGPAGNTMQVVLDTNSPTISPLIAVNALTPAGNIEAARGLRVSGTGIHDPLPVITARVDKGAAPNDQLELAVSVNGGAFSVLETIPVVNGAATLEVTHDSRAVINLRLSDDTQPSSTPIPVVYRAQLVDRAANRGPETLSNHEIGFFGCFDLKQEGGALDANEGSPPPRPHSDITDQGTCASCHTKGTGDMLQVPGGSRVNVTYRYWCTFSDTNKVVLKLLQFTQDPLLSPFMKKK